jgi:Bacterial Ig domain/NPCBM-associated, NEW3 domain of alpha-galactosidase
VTRKNIDPRIAVTALAGLIALALVPVALAGKPGGGGGGGGSHGGGGTCTQNVPTVQTDNTWSWGQSGSWGTPGQQLTYSIQIINNDSGCSSSSFTMSISAPSGFTVSVPTSTISISAAHNGYLTAYVTSPAGTADGDYPLTITVNRTSGPSGSTTSLYKVYSSDTTAPTLGLPNPGNGNALTGSSYNFTATSYDDHAVKYMELWVDGKLLNTTTCTDVTYSCQLWTPEPLSAGSHSATFKSYDWFGNVSTLTVNYTVS